MGYIILLIIVLIIVSGFKFSIQFNPFKFYFAVKDWKEVLILTVVVILFIIYGEVIREKTIKKCYENQTEQTTDHPVD